MPSHQKPRCCFNFKIHKEKWTDLEKCTCENHYNFKLMTITNTGVICSNKSTNFTFCAFDDKDEALVVADTNGDVYFINLTHNPSYQKIGSVGACTFIAFNPKDRNELILGLHSTDIKVFKINGVNDYCLLTGHSAPATHISFFKEYCLTSSCKEVIVWQLKSYFKVHQLKLNVKDIIIKKAAFSSAGLITVLYENDVIQSWMFDQFNKDYKFDLCKHGLKNVKDFVFTVDGRAMLVCGLQSKVLVFNTITWDVIKIIEINENFSGGKQLSVIPTPLDGGANNLVAILTSDCSVKFINIVESTFMETCCESSIPIKRIFTSNKGHYLTCIGKHGTLIITLLDKIFQTRTESCAQKMTETKKLHLQKTEDHLRCVREALREELKLQRLLPILKEFGEYPEKYRALIWATINDLPNNRKAFNALSNKVPIKTSDVFKDYTFSEKYRSSILTSTINCLIHWCPAAEECLYVHKLIIPFASVFQKNAVLGFEISLFVLLNYCQNWFEYHPLPPLNVLGMVENIISEADPTLFNIFCQRGITSTDYAWPILKTTMNEVLSSSDWLIMWDHLFSYRKPWLLLMCTAAYNIAYRETIIAKLRTADDFQKFYKTQGHISCKEILRIAQQLDTDIPYRIHPRRFFQNSINLLPRKGPYPPFLQNEFPKYVLDEIRISYLNKLKEKQRLLREYRLSKLGLSEEKRVRSESEKFIKSIHDMRLEEVQKSYLEQLNNEEKILKLENADLEKDLNKFYLTNKNKNWSRPTCHSRNSIHKLELEKKKKRSRHKQWQQLQEQIERLEYEVHNLLRTLENGPRRSKSRCRY